MENLLVTTGYKQQNIEKLQFDNLQKRKIQSCGSAEHFKVAMQQKGSSLITDQLANKKRYSAQDYISQLKFNQMKQAIMNKQQDQHTDTNPSECQQYKCSVINFNPSKLIPQKCIPVEKLPQIKRSRSLSEGNTFKKVNINKSTILNKFRSNSGYLSQIQSSFNLPQFSTSNYSTINNALLVSSVVISSNQESNGKENKLKKNQEILQSDKVPNYFNITSNGVPHTDRLSKFRILCEKSNQTIKQSVYSMIKQNDKQYQQLYTKHKNPVQPQKTRQRGISVNDNSPFSTLFSQNTQNSTVESMFVTENVETKFTQISEDRHSLIEELSPTNQGIDIDKRINNKDVDKNLALSLKKLQFDKYFPDSELTKKLKQYYQSHQKAYIEEQQKNLEKIRKIEIPEHQKAVIRMIKRAQKSNNSVQMANTQFNFNEAKDQLI